MKAPLRIKRHLIEWKISFQGMNDFTDLSLTHPPHTTPYHRDPHHEHKQKAAAAWAAEKESKIS
jgi:hypothetical protein